VTNFIQQNWSLLYKKQKAIRQRFPSIWNVPLKRRHTDLLIEWLQPGLSVLEIGASDRNILQKIDVSSHNVDYMSLDCDETLPHDFRSLDEVHRTFDQIWMFEVLEHLELEEGHQILTGAWRVLEPGGVLILSTPNGHHPHRFREPHHLTPFKYDNLGAILELAGFDVEQIYRAYNAPFVQKISHRFLLNWLHRFLELDFAHTLLAVARRPAGSRTPTENAQERP